MSFIPSTNKNPIARWGLPTLAGLTSCLGLLGAQQTFGYWDSLAREEATVKAQIHGHDLQTAREIRDIEAQRQRIDALRENHVSDFDQLIVQGYVIGPNPPVGINWHTSTNPDRETLIYDQNRQCIGFAYRGIFYFVNEFPEACNR